jgi:hypothetical protein
MLPTLTASLPEDNPFEETEEVDSGEPPDLIEKYAYDVQPGSPIAIPAWKYGCNWLGAAGQAFDVDGHPVDNLIVELGGSFEGEPIFGLASTGYAGDYGPGGYEIPITNIPAESSGSMWIQLKDSDGQPLSPIVFLDTLGDCTQNLILINFVAAESTSANIYYFPIVYK